jgi:predicted HicB family RNase H-like nuclease
MREKVKKIALTFRIDPEIKEGAKRVAREAKQTLSRYIDQLIKLDLWRKRLLG